MTGAMPDGEGRMPAAWWRLPEVAVLTVRYRDSRIPGLPQLAFADEFHTSLSVHGDRYVDLSAWTRFDPYTDPPGAGHAAYTALTAALPDTFTTVVSRNRPAAVWLALRIDRLTGQVADTVLRTFHHP